MSSRWPRIISRREYFWRQLLPGVGDDEELRLGILAIIEQERRGSREDVEKERPKGGTGASDSEGK